MRPPSRRLARAIRFLLAFPGTPCCVTLCDFGSGVVRLREPQRLRTACRAPATGLPAAQPHSLRRQLVGSAWTRARRDGNPTHGASTRLRFCNKVCLACAGDAQSSRDDAGSLGSTSKADLVAKNLCSIRRWFTVDVCVGKLSRRLRPPKTVYEGTPEEAPISSTVRRWPGHRHRL